MNVHGYMGEVSFEALPPWEKQSWAKEAKRVPEYCQIPDAYFANKVSLKKYVQLPNRHINPHGPTNKDWQWGFLCSDYSTETTRYIVSYYLRKIVLLLSNKKFRESAKFAGALGHYLQDSCCPAHIINNNLLCELLPFPKGQYWHLHKIFESQELKIGNPGKISYRLLGTSLKEAVFNLTNDYRKMIASVRGRLIPFLTATYRGDNVRRDIYLTECIRLGIRIVSAAWHTAFCLAFKKFDNSQAERLDTIELCDILPEIYYSQYPYFSCMPGVASDGKGGTVPLKIKLLQNGKLCEKEFRNGFAAAGTSIIIFDIPPGVYRTFSAVMGLHSSLSPKGSAGFRIGVGRMRDGELEIDGNTHEIRDSYGRKWVSLNDWVNARYVILDSGPITNREGGRMISMVLPKARRLILLTYRVTDQPFHVVWGNPTLKK